MRADAAGPVVLHAFRGGEWRTSLDTAALPGPRGAPYGLALVPEIVVHADRRRWETARGGLPPLTGRRELLLRAVELFDRGTVTVGGLGAQGPEDFRAALWETAGLPGPLVDRWCGMLRDTLLKRGEAAADDALALVALPGNTFTCLDSVLDQAERSAAVWVRPSRREPVSAARLVAALLAAGWPSLRIGLYPGEQHTLHGLVKRTDRQIVYGGTGLAASVRRSPALTLHGPGRGCALVPGAMPVDEAVAWLLPLVAGDSGRFCGNVRTILCEDGADSTAGTDGATGTDGADDADGADGTDGAVGATGADGADSTAGADGTEGADGGTGSGGARCAALASALAVALDAVSADPTGPDWPLTVFRDPEAAHRALRSVHDRMRPGDRLLTRRPAVTEVDGAPCVLPQLVLLGRGAGHPLLGHEVPFPFAAVLTATPDTVRAVTADSLFVYRPAK
ncbi:hypothetical protein [Streptomyces sp. A1499]|uniref:hypothetical protein n=1 Tax=Streptomyces sp. A1499 TaxID=2563104 RepID=UPI00144AC107|nr:hypothetical protein [Streptomyces sp. A1499]